MQRLTSYLPALTASLVTEGWALFHYVHPVSKSNDQTKGKEEKGPVQRGLKTTWWQKDKGGVSPEIYVESMTDYIAKDWQKCFSPTLKTYLAMGLESVWL